MKYLDESVLLTISVIFEPILESLSTSMTVKSSLSCSSYHCSSSASHACQGESWYLIFDFDSWMEVSRSLAKGMLFLVNFCEHAIYAINQALTY